MHSQVPAGKGYGVKEIKDGLYWVTDGAYNTMFLVTRDGVIAVDALPTIGERQIAAIREATDKPIRYLVYSHEHTDHIGAASLFPFGIQIVAQAETAATLKRRKDPRRPVPTVTFRDHLTLSLGDQELELIYPGPNHQTGNIIIWAAAAKDPNARRCRSIRATCRIRIWGSSKICRAISTSTAACSDTTSTPLLAVTSTVWEL